MSGTGYIGVDPEYQNAANPLDRPLGDPSPEALRILENEELCRRVPPPVDWRGNPIETVVQEQAPKRRSKKQEAADAAAAEQAAADAAAAEQAAADAAAAEQNESPAEGEESP